MHRQHAILIINPRSGRGGEHARTRAAERFRAALLEHGVAVETRHTAAPGDATRLADEAIGRGTRNVIVAGGDGTINEALQAVVGKSGVRLGVWARGTANVLARELRLPFDPERAARVIAAGRTRRLYVGCAVFERGRETSVSPHAAARRYFLLMAGVGLDASIVRSTPAELKRHAGEAAFWYAGLAHLARWHPATFNVEVGVETFAATFAAVGKAPRYGGGLLITPGAALCEPNFQLCVVNSHSRLRYLRLLAAALHRGVADEQTDAARLLHTTRVRAYDDAAAGDSSTLVQLDGELAGRLPVTFEIVEQPIEVFAPVDECEMKS